MPLNYPFLLDNKLISAKDINLAFTHSSTVIIKTVHSQHLDLEIDINELNNLSRDIKKFVLFTSGSTGSPKGVVLTESKLNQSAVIFCHWAQITKTSRLLCLAPMSSMSGLRAHYSIALVSKCELIENNTDNSIFSLLILIENQQMTHIIAGPPFIKQLSILAKRIDPQSLKSLQYILCTGANIDTDAIAVIWNTFGIKTLNYYGLTESYGFCIAVQANDFDCNDASIGKAVLGVSLEIIDPDENNIGRLRLHSERIFEHYLGQPRSHRTFLDTGDFARIDNKGNVYLHGRIDHALKLSSTELIYPIQLEKLLSKSLNGSQVNVYSLSSGFGVWIVSHQTLAQITEQLKSVLDAKYIPSEIKIVSHIAFNALGKIQKNKGPDV